MGSRSPRVSVVLPVRDGARHVEESVESVLAQTLEDWELVAVDDGSVDATPRILAAYAAKDPRIRTMRNEPARRLPGALNRGFAAARGELLTWTSDDNAYAPGALAALAAALDARADAAIAYADYALVDEHGVVQGEKRLPEASHLGYSNVVGPCFLFRRNVLEALGGYAEDLFLAEDYDFWLRAATRFRFVHVSQSLYRYRQHPASLTSTRGAEVRRATARALERSAPHLPRRMRAEAYTRLEHLAEQGGDAAAARAWRGRALRTAPLVTARRLARRWLGRG